MFEINRLIPASVLAGVKPADLRVGVCFFCVAESPPIFEFFLSRSFSCASTLPDFVACAAGTLTAA